MPRQIVMGQPLPNYADRISEFLTRIGQQRRIDEEQQRREAVAYLTSLPQEQRAAAIAAMNPQLQKSVGGFGFNAPLPKTREQQYEDRLFQERQAALNGTAPARQPAVGPMNFDDVHVAAGAGATAPDPYQQLQANALRNSLITNRAPTKEELDLGGAYYDRGNAGFSRANSISTGELPSGYQSGVLRENTRHNQETERQGNVRTGAYVNASGAQATASRALAGLRGEQTTTERELRDASSPAVGAQIAIRKAGRAPVPRVFIEDSAGYKSLEKTLTGLSEEEAKLQREIAGSEEMLSRFPGAVSEQQKLRRTRGQLSVVKAQIDQKKKEGQKVVGNLKKAGLLFRDEYMTRNQQQGGVITSTPSNGGSASPLSDDMRAAIRALDPSISDQEIEAILNEGGSE